MKHPISNSVHTLFFPVEVFLLCCFQFYHKIIQEQLWMLLLIISLSPVCVEILEPNLGQEYAWSLFALGTHHTQITAILKIKKNHHVVLPECLRAEVCKHKHFHIALQSNNDTCFYSKAHFKSATSGQCTNHKLKVSKYVHAADSNAKTQWKNTENKTRTSVKDSNMHSYECRLKKARERSVFKKIGLLFLKTKNKKKRCALTKRIRGD